MMLDALNENHKVLVLAPHTDDAEIGCGATISRLRRQGCFIKIIAFSACEESIPKGFSSDALRNEAFQAVKVFGLPQEALEVLNFPVRRFQDCRQDILESMVGLRRSIHFDLVLLPNSFDIHQDHQVIHNEGVRAFKFTSVLGYEFPWNNFQLTNSYFVELHSSDLDTKADSIDCYHTQKSIRPYVNREFVESLARVRGLQSGFTYAEAFEVVRIMGRL